MFILCQWFSQLFALLILSALHFIAVFSPAKFRLILPRHMWITNFFIIVIGILLTAPTFTPYCGYAYMTESHVWADDKSKPYTYIWRRCNLSLQAVCVIVLACVDAVIIWKIRTLRIVGTKRNDIVPSSRITVPLETRSNREKRINREKRLALNFVFLSACFLFQSTVYNLPFRLFVPSSTPVDEVLATSKAMDMETALYVTNFAINTFIIFIDVTVIFVAIKTGEFARQLILWIIFLCMGMDIAVYLNTVIHDVPSFVMNTDIFKLPMFTPYCGYSYVIQGHYWYLDTSKPYSYLYRSWNLVLQITCAAVVAFVDVLIIWKIRMSRNIARKNKVLGPFYVTAAGTMNREKRINREKRLALNFVFLSACFLFQTIVYNLPFRSVS
ncbi:unnamed protein product [Haemonchus placei]|uniref:7TM_GPCR_Srx domain-containing protein n=1 Tax=Haemonchus placei TaxID=6290 RepID=A0A3P7ZT55_HAEPC|nr:unnamed protein product [Haemonchus placei]